MTTDSIMNNYTHLNEPKHSDNDTKKNTKPHFFSAKPEELKIQPGQDFMVKDTVCMYGASRTELGLKRDSPHLELRTFYQDVHAQSVTRENWPQ